MLNQRYHLMRHEDTRKVIPKSILIISFNGMIKNMILFIIIKVNAGLKGKC